jgi:hypothetical protein
MSSQPTAFSYECICDHNNYVVGKSSSDRWPVPEPYWSSRDDQEEVPKLPPRGHKYKNGNLLTLE